MTLCGAQYVRPSPAVVVMVKIWHLSVFLEL